MRRKVALASLYIHYACRLSCASIATSPESSDHQRSRCRRACGRSGPGQSEPGPKWPAPRSPHARPGQARRSTSRSTSVSASLMGACLRYGRATERFERFKNSAHSSARGDHTSAGIVSIISLRLCSLARTASSARFRSSMSVNSTHHQTTCPFVRSYCEEESGPTPTIDAIRTAPSRGVLPKQIELKCLA